MSGVGMHAWRLKLDFGHFSGWILRALVCFAGEFLFVSNLEIEDGVF